MSSAPRSPDPDDRRAGGRVTAARVAERAGVSVATVSLVVNGKTAGRVSAGNIERVRAAVDELGYIVDPTARSLARGRSSVVILVAPDLHNPYFGRVIYGIKNALDGRYQLLLSVTNSGAIPAAADITHLRGLRPAGLFVDAPTREFLTELGSEIPLVLMDAPGFEHLANTVNFDLVPAVTALGEHLLERGHRRIGYLDSVTGTQTFRQRREVLAGALAAGGAGEMLATASRVDVAEAAAAFSAAWPAWSEAGVSAVACATDTQAYGVLAAARERGLRVPEDLAVSGFDNLPYSMISAPALTSVDLPGDEMGRYAAIQLMARLDRAPGEAMPPPPILRAALVVRESTSGSAGPARR